VQGIALAGAPPPGVVLNAWLPRLAVLCLLSLGPRSILAQTVRGTVLDSESGSGVYAADVLLLTADEAVVGRYVTEQDGSFVIPVRSPGRYRLRAARIGYVSFTTDAFQLRSGQEAVAHISLRIRPIPLDPLEAVVEAPRPRRLVEVGFYRRQERGIGQFLAPEDLAGMHLHFLRDLFWGMGGIRVRTGRTGEVTVFKSLGALMTGMQGGPCRLSVSVDGQVVEGGGNYKIGSGPWTDVVHVNDIEAVEVYSGAAGVPGWASRYSPCGAILIWTRGSLR
jgi:hypothetical protein